MTLSGNKKEDCAILYSGGTDSTCAAALMAEVFSGIHLLTFYQKNKKYGCVINDNINSLRNKFTDNIFIHKVIPITRLVRFISYNKYLRYLFKHKWLVLSDCGFTALSWHINTIGYCFKNSINVVADGLTRELMHFPGHMDEVIGIFRDLYREFGIQYINPVREWEIPPDRQFIDRLIVDQHGYFFPDEKTRVITKRTTGQYLYRLGIMPNSYVKGSPLDHSMQYDCYPFVLYNIMVFWIYLNLRPYEYLCQKMKCLFEDKINDIRPLLKEYVMNGEKSKLSRLLDKVCK